MVIYAQLALQAPISERLTVYTDQDNKTIPFVL